jgi:hypothetical protein
MGKIRNEIVRLAKLGMIRPMHLDQNSAIIEKSDEKPRVIVPEAAP